MPVLPFYIVELCLQKAFKGYASPIESCLFSSAQDEILIADNKDVGYTIMIDKNSEDYLTGRVLIIKNVKENDISILQIDNKLISPRSKQKRCDCAILNVTDMRFIEFKTNSQGNSVKAIESTYRQAIKQLSTTLHLFISKERNIGIDLQKKRSLSAHICTSVCFPRLSAAQIGYAIDFALQEHVPLTFGTITNI
jgi:hypothetical protein